LIFFFLFFFLWDSFQLFPKFEKPFKKRKKNCACPEMEIHGWVRVGQVDHRWILGRYARALCITVITHVCPRRTRDQQSKRILDSIISPAKRAMCWVTWIRLSTWQNMRHSKRNHVLSEKKGGFHRKRSSTSRSCRRLYYITQSHHELSWIYNPTINYHYHEFIIPLSLWISWVFFFFRGKLQWSRKKREKEVRKSKNENTRLRRWGRENLTVLPYLRIYSKGLNAVGKSCLETLHTTNCVTRTALDRLCSKAGRSSTLRRNLLMSFESHYKLLQHRGSRCFEPAKEHYQTLVCVALPKKNELVTRSRNDRW
jgi:hypothetical protein